MNFVYGMIISTQENLVEPVEFIYTIQSTSCQWAKKKSDVMSSFVRTSEQVVFWCWSFIVVVVIVQVFRGGDVS